MASREIRGRRGACRAVAVLGLPASAATGMELCHQELNGEAVSVVIITPPELFADAAAGYSASPLLEQAGGRRPEGFVKVTRSELLTLAALTLTRTLPALPSFESRGAFRTAGVQATPWTN